jgi:tetratricopeptide (TPR) repeat protein
VKADDLMSIGAAALAAGRWVEARDAFAETLAAGDSAEARFGLATAMWWLGENLESVEQCTAAYSLFRRAGDVDGAVGCALWLGITYKANFANFPAANGWIARAERLLEPIGPGSAHASLWITRAYRMADLANAEKLTRRALDLARSIGDVDLELIAASQLGLIDVGQGHVSNGLAQIDEAMAAVLGGEACNLDTVVYTCCDMLNACELAGDAERAAQWCKVADQFVATYGCPFLYAECRILYGGVLTAIGRWDEARPLPLLAWWRSPIRRARSSPRSPQRPVAGSPPARAMPARRSTIWRMQLRGSPTSECRSKRLAPATPSLASWLTASPIWPWPTPAPHSTGSPSSAPPSTPTVSPTSCARTAWSRGPARRASAH